MSGRLTGSSAACRVGRTVSMVTVELMRGRAAICAPTFAVVKVGLLEPTYGGRKTVAPLLAGGEPTTVRIAAACKHGFDPSQLEPCPVREMALTIESPGCAV